VRSFARQIGLGAHEETVQQAWEVDRGLKGLPAIAAGPVSVSVMPATYSCTA
jgi:hypothetical protein